MAQEAEGKKPGERALEHVEYANRLYEAISGAIAAISAINAFVSDLGGPVAFLVQVGVMGFALYLSLFVALPVALGVNHLLERGSGRESTDKALLVMVVGLLILIAIAIRLWVFYDGIGAPGDFDAIGTSFAAIVGVLILCAPLVALWWRKGSVPRTTPS
jgi:hypothetical protein